MRGLRLAGPGERLRVLALGAHSDDIEIGCGGTILHWIASGVRIEVHWCVLSGTPDRHAEARAAAESFLEGAAVAEVELLSFRDGHFPYDGAALKAWFERLKSRPSPDVVLTHTRDDRHQDHREVCQLTWNTFRDHLILEYEIPKWDGDLGRPQLHVPLPAACLERKIALLMRHFGSQRSKRWFDEETFRGLARLRGMECCAPERYAEAFYTPKLSLLLG
jgi:LmbE family N-acetylglucosaminyl deacetylase